jgi:outer membrane protein OmpA-like peptidoglycan-associated protein
MSRRHLARLSVGAAALLWCSGAQAQATAEGFSINRFDPSERGSEWFSNDSLDLRGHGRFAAGLVLDYAHRPLVYYAPSGDKTIVGDQFFGHFGATVNLWDSVRFGLNFPVALFQDGEGATTSTTNFALENQVAPGDLRLGFDVRLYGKYRSPIELATGLGLYLPTGSRTSYTGDGAVHAIPHFIVAGESSGFVYSARLGMHLRGQADDFAGSAMGSEIVFGAAAGARLDKDRIVLGPELYGSTVFTDGDAFFARRTTPLEVLLGGHYLAGKSIRVGVGFAPGLTRAFGTPLIRVVGSVEWVQPMEEPKPPPPPAKPKDRDHDGIIDPEDACPDEPGEKNDDPKKNGCPPPKDTDGDGILNPEDACPTVPGIKTDNPATNGCPPADRDGDTIIDSEDACPDEPGIKTNDPATNGCPPPKDRDKDGILNNEDACPDDPGPANPDPKKNGCPVAHIEKGEIKIREQVQFAYNSAQILKASDFILEAVQKILKENPNILKVEVQGHTDSKGGDAFNKKLSDRRAASVVKWLTSHGVDANRLTSVGWGEEKPIDSNDTDEGRANNRRVEFHILDQSGPVGPGTEAPKPAAPAEEKKTEEKKPAEEKKSDEKKPAADKKPAEEKKPAKTIKKDELD